MEQKKTKLTIISDSAHQVADPSKLTRGQWEAAARALANIAALEVEVRGNPDILHIADIIKAAAVDCLVQEGFDPQNWFVLVHPHTIPERVVQLPFRRWRVHTRLIQPERNAGQVRVTIAEKTNGA
jgi:uncharacterized protein (UPF0218 family)